MVKKRFLAGENLGNFFAQGFTLIELLVVISVIGILAAVLLVNFVGVRGRAGDAAKKSNARQLKTALRLYYNDYQVYPGVSGTLIAGCGGAGTAACSVGESFSAGTANSIYMNQIPVGTYYYSDGVGFLVMTKLENGADAEIAASQARCDVTNRSYFTDTLDEATDYFVCED